MRNWSWKDFEDSKGPLELGFKVVIVIFLLGLIITPISCVLNYLGSASKVVSQEVSPEVLLKKYEWFKNASAELDKKQADIKVY